MVMIFFTQTLPPFAGVQIRTNWQYCAWKCCITFI